MPYKLYASLAFAIAPSAMILETAYNKLSISKRLEAHGIEGLTRGRFGWWQRPQTC
jgi:hypothetical protein